VLCSDGTLAAWGRNSGGQLGNGSTVESGVPVLVDRAGVLAGKSVVAISAAGDHSLALCADGTLAAWGRNDHGQLGNNGSSTSTVPVLVDRSGALAGKTVTSIAAGLFHNLALCSDGTLVAWGRNTYGQLGTGTTTGSKVPVPVNRAGALSGRIPAAIAAGCYGSLVLCTDGSLAAWGRNNHGQLGNNGTTDSSLPALVDQAGALAGKTVTSIAAGNFFHFALCDDATLFGWGYNAFGQLGNNSTTNRSTPAPVSRGALTAGERFMAVNGEEMHSLALIASPPPPVFDGFAFSSSWQTPTSVSVRKLLARAGDPDGDALALTAAGPASARGGSVALQAGAIVYVPPSGYSGSDSFQITITDATGASVTGTVMVEVRPPVPAAGVPSPNPPQITGQPGGKLGVTFRGIPGRTYRIQRSPDLSAWATVATVVAGPTGGIHWLDESPPQPSAYYRLVTR
jgi:alpha-tubulin suppressor-like RCC1 family protein